MSIETRRRSQAGIRMNEKDNKEIAYEDDHHDFHPDPAVIARLRRKIDWNLLPLLSLMYLFSFLDRVNIGIRAFFLELSTLSWCYPARCHSSFEQQTLTSFSYFLLFCPPTQLQR